MPSEIEIANMALSHLGVGKEIQLITERSEEARAINRYYSMALDELLSEFDWPHARKEAALNEAETDPPAGWSYAYRQPSDCVLVRKVVSGIHPEDKDSAIKFDTGADEIGNLIFTNQPDAVLRYTSRSTSPSHYPPKFAVALSYLLAFYAAPRLGGSNAANLKKEVRGAYDAYLAKAKADAANSQKRPLPGGSEFERGRG